MRSSPCRSTLPARPVNAAGKVAMRVVPRDPTDLEDMLDPIAILPGNRPWVTVNSQG